MANAFERAGHLVGRFDYKARRSKFKPWWMIRHELFGINDTFEPDIVFIQQAEGMPAYITRMFNVPVVFWSTESLARRQDIGKLLSGRAELDWVYLHTYSCLDIVEKNSPYLLPKCSVMHNAGAVEHGPGNATRSKFAIFNRKVSPRRQQWLTEVGDIVEVRSDVYGEPYLEDLRDSVISVNIHFAQESVDEFETGIFEALASGCVVVTETLNARTVADIGMQDALIQVGSAREMKEQLLKLKNDPARIALYQENARQAMLTNSWDSRATLMLEKFAELV